MGVHVLKMKNKSGALIFFLVIFAACNQAPTTPFDSTMTLTPFRAPTNLPVASPTTVALASPIPVPNPSATPAPSLTPFTPNLLLEFKRQGGIAGFCDSIRIKPDGLYTYANDCRGLAKEGRLSANQLGRLRQLGTRLHKCDWRDEPSPLPPDYLVIAFIFYGTGGSNAEEADVNEIKAVAQSVMNAELATTLPAVALTPTSASADLGVLIFTREGNRLYARDLATDKEWLITEAKRDYDFTRDGKRIVFVDPIESGPMGALWTVNVDGTNAKKLTTSLKDMHPRWSPDATKIVFERGVVMDAALIFTLSAEVWVINSDGTGQQKLADGFDPEWSPEGKRIAYATNPLKRGENTSDGLGYMQNALGLMNVQGENKWTPVTTQTKSANFTVLEWNMSQARLIDSPHWSPEGKEIAFRVLDTHTTYLTTDATKGGIASFIWLEFDSLARAFSYSPNGRYITIGLGGNSGYATLGVFTRSDVGDKGYSQQLKIEEFGTVPRAANQIGMSVLGFAWSPDGNSLAYALASGEGNHAVPKGIWIARADGSAQRLAIADGRAPLFWITK